MRPNLFHIVFTNLPYNWNYRSNLTLPMYPTRRWLYSYTNNTDWLLYPWGIVGYPPHTHFYSLHNSLLWVYAGFKPRENMSYNATKIHRVICQINGLFLYIHHDTCIYTRSYCARCIKSGIDITQPPKSYRTYGTKPAWIWGVRLVSTKPQHPYFLMHSCLLPNPDRFQWG
jgi:hypothetical protein